MIRKNTEMFSVRMPDGMRDRVQILARSNHRSMNMEFVAAVENHLSATGYEKEATHDPCPVCMHRVVQELENVEVERDELIHKIIDFERENDRLRHQLQLRDAVAKDEGAQAAAQTQQEAHAKDRLINAREAMKLLGLSNSGFYGLVNSGVLPQPIKFGPRLARWRVSEIEAAIAEAECRSRRIEAG